MKTKKFFKIRWLFIVILFYSFSVQSFAQERLRVIVETDIGGDPDDQASFVRWLLYTNEFDIEAIITTRPVGDDREPDGGYALAKSYIEAYGEVVNNLKVHDPNFPSESELLSVLKRGDNNDGRDAIIAAVDKNDPRPIWYTNWGADDGRTSSLKKALDYVQSNRSGSQYTSFINKIHYVEYYKQNHVGDSHRANLPFYMCSYFPDMDGGRWYHRFQPLTETAGGFSQIDDLRENHGPLCALYPTQKEGDTPSFLHLFANGLNVPGRPDWGSWSGRFSYGNIFTDCNRDVWANNQRDTWNGSTNRDNTLLRWAAHLQMDFKARADWCVATSYSAANHHPAPKINGNAGLLPVYMKRMPGELVSLSASGSTDPDGNSISYQWVYYQEAGTYSGNISIANANSISASFTAPGDFAEGDTIHIILVATDNGAPNLTRYKRAIITFGQETPTQILCLGNSITQGSNGHDSYRKNLYYKLADAGYNFDFVGSLSKNNSCSDFADGGFDHDHEGHWGWRTDEIINGRSTSCYGNGKLADWLSGYTPDLVLLHLGTNDVFQENSNSSTVSELEQIIDILRADNPNVVIFLAKLIPTDRDATKEQGIQNLNSLITGIASNKNTAQSPVILVDQFEGFNAATDTHDDVHPNDLGEEKMAQKWFDAINSYFQGNSAPNVSIASPLDGTTITEGNNLQITAAASDIDGSVTKVEFFAGTTKLGEDNSSPYQYTWTEVPFGNYEITAVAYDNDGSAKISTPIQLNVRTLVTYDLVVNSGSGDGTYEQQSVIQITADAPPTGLVFDKWTGDVANVENIKHAVTNITLLSDATVTATFAPPPPQLFTNIVANSSYTYERQEDLQVGDEFYTDRTYTIQSLPVELTGVEYIKTANNDRSSTASDLLTFDLTATSVVYIAYDYRATSLPDWMYAFSPTGMVISTDDINMNVYSAELLSGHVEFGSIKSTGGAGAVSNYFVMAIPAGTPADSYSLTVNNGSGDGTYIEGANVSITADAAPSGQVFDAWVGDVSNIANVNSAATTLTMPAASTIVSASYKNAPEGDCSVYTELAVSSITASAEQTGNWAINVNDDDLSTKWSVDGVGQYITMDLGIEKTVSSLEIAWAAGSLRVYNFDIQSSSDGVNFIDVQTDMNSSGTSDDLQSFDITDVVARYIRYIGYGSNANNWTNITEFNIIGCDGVSVETFDLTVSNGTGSGTYNSGTVVDIVADAAPANQVFSAWTGDVTAVADVHSASTSITLTANATITATYVDIVTYTLTVVNGSGSGEYTTGTVIDIVANIPQSGQVFDTWTGDVTDVADINSASTTITLLNDAIVTATYKDAPSGDCNVYTELPISGVSASAEQTDNWATNVIDGDLGTRWSADGQGQYITLDLGSDNTVTSLDIAWAAGSSRVYNFDIQFSSDGVNFSDVETNLYSSGTSNSLQNFDISDVVARYIRYVGYGSNANNWNNITEFVINGCTDVTIETYTLTVSSGTGSGTYNSGTVVSIVADAAPTGQVFDSWTGDVSAVADVNAASTSITLTANQSISARYTDAPSQLITNVSTSTSYSFERDESMNVGDVYYTDRSYTIQSLPTDLQGAEYIKTPNSARSSSANDIISFTLSADAVVYVAYDSRAGSLPSWMSAFVSTGESISTTDITLNVFSANLSAGQHTFGSISDTGANSFYLVAAVLPGSNKSGILAFESEGTNEINLFPNPASSYFILSNLNEIKMIQIVNIAGMVLESRNVYLDKVRIDVDNYNSGIYFIKVIDNNSEVSSKKILIQ